VHSKYHARWSIPALLFLFLLFPNPVDAGVDPIKYKALRLQAEYHEQQAEWDKACLIYDNLIKLDRAAPEIQERYQLCLRRFLQARRHADPSYRKEVLSLDYAQSIRLYTMIRNTILDNALDKKKTDPGKLFRKGLEEFDNALTDPYFLQQYCPSVKSEDMHTFREFLKKTWGRDIKLSRLDAIKHLREVALAAQNALQLSCNLVFMEFACGACHALDEYTIYLNPNQLRVLCDSMRGELAGVGLTLRLYDNKLFVHELIALSPAAEIDDPPLSRDDQILSIDKKSVAQMSPEAAQELLDGPNDSTVDLEVFSPGMLPRIITLRRRAIFMPSIAHQMQNDRIGYLRIACFQDSTAQELEDALTSLSRDGMKALILDIRANGGGLFEVAIEVSRRFLSTGVITSTQNSDPKYSTVYQARNPNALTLPLVVMIDGDTASAAEVLAGALKDNKRGRLVGQTTFGKGCVQCVLKLPSAPGNIATGGMRLTVARFFSPEGIPYSGRGVTPHIPVEPFFLGSMNSAEPQMDAAMLEAQRLLNARP